MIKNLPTPPPPPPPSELPRPMFQQGTKTCPISCLKGYGATQTYKWVILGSASPSPGL